MLKATILLENLKDSLSFTHHAVSSRSALPVLLNFLLEAREGELIISAADLELGIKASVPARIEREGEVTVNAKTFFDLINNISEEKIELEEKEGGLFLSANRTKAHFPVLPATEFPKLFEEKGEKTAVFKKKDFDDAVTKTVFAAAQDTTRPALSGLLISHEEKGITIVATDGYRLSLKRNLSMKNSGKKTDESMLVSARVIKEVIGAKEDGELGLYVNPSSSQAVFEIGDTILVGRLIDAEYPDYQKIIPQDLTTKAEFDRQEALSAVRSCSVIAREAANIIKIAVGKNKLTFSAQASSTGENEVEIEAKVVGEENEIAFNARYLMDFLTNVSEERLTFEMTGPLNPGVFRIAGDDSYLHLIMPIRVTE
jgi:DNA polymerase-3 subunit beta